MDTQSLRTPGCLRLFPHSSRDERGEFVKHFVLPEFEELQLPVQYAEEYYSISARNVLRGMHFQLPPFEHAKLVTCQQGSIRDALVDLRIGSPTYLQAEVIDLKEGDHSLLFLPPGIAHGFLVLSEWALVSYKVTSLYARASDAGIRWNSIGVEWGIHEPILSARDASFPRLADFQSPFDFDLPVRT